MGLFILWSIKNYYCVVPENIHTPTTEGIGNCKGEGGGSKTKEIPEGRGVVWAIYFPEVFDSIRLSKILSYLVSRTFTWKKSGLSTCILLTLHLKCIFFLQKALWKLINAKKVLLRGSCSHYLLPVHTESPYAWKALDTSLVGFRIGLEVADNLFLKN